MYKTRTYHAAQQLAAQLDCILHQACRQSVPSTPSPALTEAIFQGDIVPVLIDQLDDMAGDCSNKQAANLQTVRAELMAFMACPV